MPTGKSISVKLVDTDELEITNAVDIREAVAPVVESARAVGDVQRHFPTGRDDHGVGEDTLVRCGFGRVTLPKVEGNVGKAAARVGKGEGGVERLRNRGRISIG